MSGLRNFQFQVLFLLVYQDANITIKDIKEK